MEKYDIEKQKWNKKASSLLHDTKLQEKCLNYKNVFSSRNTLRPVYKYFDLRDNEATILDVGAGAGWTTILLAQESKSVTCFDISLMRTKVLKAKSDYNSILNVHAAVSNAEDLPFKDETFDYVFGNAILHHLNLDATLSEIKRVLRKGGKAAFCEPFAHNPLINLYRFIKHNYIEEFKGTDKPLKYSDKKTFEKYFSNTKFIETSFFSDKVPRLRPFEASVLEKCSFLRKFVGYITILLQK